MKSLVCIPSLACYLAPISRAAKAGDTARLIDSDPFVWRARVVIMAAAPVIAFLSHILKMRLRSHWLKVAAPKGTQQ